MGNGKDAAWASINTPLTPEALRSFCLDVERLFRINPMLTFNEWSELEAGHFRCKGQNWSQERPFDFELEFKVESLPEGIRINYLGESLKSSTLFRVEKVPEGGPGLSRLTIVDEYNEALPEEVRQAQLHRVDRSIRVWAEYLLRYLIIWDRWSWCPPWRWYMQRIWLPMKPSGRRITYMLLWISALEVALIGLGVIIYYLEYA